MPWEIDSITDPEQRLAWLRAQGRADAEAVIERGAAGTRDAYHLGARKLPIAERSAYREGYRDRMHERTLERKAAGIEVVSPDYRGPLTETDWWRGITITSPDGTVVRSPGKSGRPERRKQAE